MQLLSDLTGLEVERAKETEMSILGVALLAGLQSGKLKKNNIKRNINFLSINIARKIKK